MRVGQFLQELCEQPIVSLDALTDGGSFAVLAPHPDDESLGAGGLIAAARAQGQRVSVVAITHGTASHPNSRHYPPERLGAVRIEELKRACGLLGIHASDVATLAAEDTRVPLRGPSFESLADRIAALLLRQSIETVFASWGQDPHCDHEATAALAVALRSRVPRLTIWFYPVWAWQLPADTAVPYDYCVGARFDVSDVLQQKMAAIQAHASQWGRVVADDPDGFCLTAEMLLRFSQRYEHFIGPVR